MEKSKDFEKNVVATFAGNPEAKEFWANEHGHCFGGAVEGFTHVKRSDYEKAITALETTQADAEQKSAEEIAKAKAEEAANKNKKK